MVDQFRIVRLLGRGGMGEVYLARDATLGRKVALKLIHPKHLGTERSALSFLDEARMTARFSHPHIVTVYGVGEHQGRPYIALEYLEGQTLKQRLQDQRPSHREMLRIALAIAEALCEAHRHGVLHRDLKPDNVLIPRDGRLRVLDFGLATQIEAHVADTPIPEPLALSDHPTLKEDELETYSSMATRTHSLGGQASMTLPPINVDASPRPARTVPDRVVGTPQYMAPEQWLGREVGGTTDIWALGVVLFEMATGDRPYPMTTPSALSLRVIAPEPAPDVAAHAELPAELADLIRACMRKDPNQRPSAQEVVGALERMLQVRRGERGSELNPFRGLLPFAERHADLFFGRGAEIDAFVERLREQPTLAVLGASGAGKSSFVQAGVVPRLREQGPWVVLRLRPGAHPFAALAARLHGGESTAWDSSGSKISRPAQREEDAAGSVDALALELQQTPGLLSLHLLRLAEREQARVLLFVDQLEELATMVDDQALRERFLLAVGNAADDPAGPVRAVFTLRDDFLGRLAGGPELTHTLSQVTVLKSPAERELVEILTRPVEALGFGYEDEHMVTEMVAAVRGEQACLPLLQFAAQSLWDRRDKARSLLLRSAHDGLGGVAGALATHADGVLASLPPDQVTQARALFLRLVSVEGTRRVLVREAALDGLPGEASHVLDRLVQARLITQRKAASGQSAALELAHESLVQSWAQLRRWLDEGREEMTFLAEADQAAELWERRGQRSDEVWQGQALQDALRSRSLCAGQLPGRVQRFLDAGLRRQRRRQRGRRTLLASGVALLTAVAAGSLLFSLALADKEREASDQRDRAEHQRLAAEQRSAEALWESSRAALLRGELLEARAKLRASLEIEDTAAARALWWRLSQSALWWRRELGAGLYEVRFSADGGTIALAAQDRAVYLIDVATQRTRILHGHDDQVVAVGFAPDGAHLIAATWSGTLTVWDLDSETVVRTIPAPGSGLWSMAVSPKGYWLATAHDDHLIRVWKWQTGALEQTLAGHTEAVLDVDISPDGRHLLSASRDRSARLWDLESGELRHSLFGPGAEVAAVRFSADGTRVASVGPDGAARIWGTTRGDLQQTMRWTDRHLFDVAFVPGGHDLVLSTAGGDLRLFDEQSGVAGRFLPRHSTGASIALSPDGRHLATASMDKVVQIVDLGIVEAPRIERGHAGEMGSIRFSPDGNRLSSVGNDGTQRTWDVRTGEQLEVRGDRTRAIACADYSPDGRWLAVADHQHVVVLHDRHNGQLRKLRGHDARIKALAFSPDGRWLASAGYDHKVLLWNLQTFELQRSFLGHLATVSDVRFSADSGSLLSASWDLTARVWSIRGGPAQVLRGHTGALWSASFADGGRRALTTGEDGSLRLWDLRAGTSQTLWQTAGRLYYLDLHPDGQRVGLPGSDGIARIFDRRDGVTLDLLGHRAEVGYLRFDPSGDLAATSGDDGTVRLWRVDNGRPIWRAPLAQPSRALMFSHLGWISLHDPPLPDSGRPHHRAWESAVARGARLAVESSDGHYICIATFGGQLELWDTTSDQLLSALPQQGIERLLGTPDGCVYVAGGEADLIGHDASPTHLASQVTAVGLADGQLLLSTGERILRFDLHGVRRDELPAKGGVSALTQTARGLVLGFVDGNIELRAWDSTGRVAESTVAIAFESTPSSAVQRLVAGPLGTLAASYASGDVGLWDVRSGARLQQARLHGSVEHLFIGQRTLYAGSDLGDHLSWDLSAFMLEPCTLLREVRHRIPVLWEQGAAVLAPPLADDRCGGR